MSRENIRVLIVSEHASYQFGGEASLPAHYFRVLAARGLDTWLITHERVRQELDSVFSRHPRIVYIKDTWLHKLMCRAGQHLPDRISYITTGYISRIATQISAKRIAKSLIKENRIDVVHQPIPVSPKEPSLLFEMGAPVVIGPMNGGIDYPPALKEETKLLEKISIRVGRFFSEVVNRLIPGKMEAARLLAANPRTALALPRSVQPERVHLLVENGVDLTMWRPSRDAGGAGDHCTFVFVGRLVGWKAVEIIIEAFSRIKDKSNARLWIIGDGPQRGSLEKLARDRAIIQPTPQSWGGIHFFGWQQQSVCAELVASADVLLLPSLMECGGAVVLEGMACGLPVIATAWGGPLDYLNEECGFLIEPTSRAHLVDGFLTHMERLLSDPEKRAVMGRAGQQRVMDHFDWERKVDRMLEIYNAAIEQSPRA